MGPLGQWRDGECGAGERADRWTRGAGRHARAEGVCWAGRAEWVSGPRKGESGRIAGWARVGKGEALGRAGFQAGLGFLWVFPFLFLFTLSFQI